MQLGLACALGQVAELGVGRAGIEVGHYVVLAVLVVGIGSGV